MIETLEFNCLTTSPGSQNISPKLSNLLKKLSKMDMATSPMGLSTSVLRSIRKNSNTENSNESRQLKPNNKKRTKKDKREIRMILLYGRLPSLISLLGSPNGVKGGLDGIFSARLWLLQFWGRKLTYILEELI